MALESSAILRFMDSPIPYPVASREPVAKVFALPVRFCFGDWHDFDPPRSGQDGEDRGGVRYPPPQLTPLRDDPDHLTEACRVRQRNIGAQPGHEPILQIREIRLAGNLHP